MKSVQKKSEKERKMPISQEKIFKIMFWIMLIVSGVFLVKNIITKNVAEALLIAGTIVIFAVIFLILYLRKASEHTKQLIISIGLLCMVFLISLSSGDYYSDDFIMFLAVIALSGLYLEPKFTMIQVVIADIFLILMYVINPDKADPLGQYIQCWAEFTLGGFLLCLTIKRGRAYIGIGEERTQEAVGLVHSMKEMGEDLEHDFAQSSKRIDNNTKELKKGSQSIVVSADNMNAGCNDVQDCIQISQQSIQSLGEDVIRFELALKENAANMENMQKQLAIVSDTIYGANEVFQMMEHKMNEVSDIAERLGDISFNTSILSLNASIEAARAGESGAGFDVVATEMRQLSNNSNIFSEQVSDVVKELLLQVGNTAEQFAGSTKALEESKATMTELTDSFKRLTERFDSLYGNIETQNTNVNQVGTIFYDLRGRVAEMQKYSEDNQAAVEAIVEAMDVYKININKVIENTKKAEISKNIQ